MRAFLLALLTIILLPLSAFAQATDRPNTILVLDGSGSMWGQIDGVNKIVIARNVIADLLEDMADDVSLGLTVYGHRQRGSCGDIETIVEPAPFTQDRILEAVNSINPRGRTPMTDAVIAAAQSLRHTEEAATVILVSDGIENCNPDPCAIAAELEATGVAFTAHVIGFDVASEPEARAQMQCIADNTGGQFLTADNAAELSAALEQVVVAAQPTPMRIEAQVLPQGNLPTRTITWTLLGADGDVISQGTQAPAIDVALMPGAYIAQATRAEPDGPVTYQTGFEVIEGQTDLIVVAMPPIIETSSVTFTARVEPDMSVPASQLNWTLQDAEGTVLLGPVSAPAGNVALLPGEYLLTVERVSQGTTHQARFTVEPNTPQQVIIPLPALMVDVTFIARIGDVGGLPVTDPVIWDIEPIQSNPMTANPASTQLGRGAYRVTAYWTAQEIEATADFVIVDQPREIVVVFDEPVPQATVTAPATAVAGSPIEVGWTGPEEQYDFIAVRAPDSEGFHRFINDTRLDRGGNPLPLLMPTYPGTYLIEYIRNDGRVAIASTEIEVTEVTATVTAPATAPAGETIEIGWTGPDYQYDFIAVRRPDSEGFHRFINDVRTERGNPSTLAMPSEPGTYVIEYILNQDRRPLAAATIEVTDVPATLTAPATAAAGDTIEVGFTGPEYRNDFIAIRSPDSEGYHRFANTVRANEGNPAQLLMPTQPGTYLIEYIEAQDRSPLAAVEITVTPVTASLTAPANANVGDVIEIGWTGPDYRNDFIAIRRPDSEGYHRFAETVRTDRGNPARLAVPSEPGTYLIEYIEGQDRTALASAELIVSESAASVTAPASAVAGSTIEVGWTGPNADRDYIAIGRAGAEGGAQWENYTRTSEGNPVRLLVPMEPGDYVVQYFLNQDNVSLASAPLTVTAAEATITVPQTAVAGSTIEVGWTGPDYDRDYIGIGRAGAEGGARWENYTRTSEGNPVRLLVPTEPGTYEVTYFTNQDNAELATATIEVTAAAATLTLPQTAVAGSTIDVGWTGPDYDRDYIGIGLAGAEGGARWVNYARTSDGNPARLLVPPQPGTYEVTYFMNQDNAELATTTLTVSPVEATLTVPATAAAGTQIEVGWTGPDYDRDFIAIGPAGASGGDQWQAYTYTEAGSPLSLQMPDAPGSYVIQYFLNQGNTSVASVPITVQ